MSRSLMPFLPPGPCPAGLPLRPGHLCPSSPLALAPQDFRGTLDYILFTSNSLVPTAVLELPSDSEVVAPNEQMPNGQYSSDHLALLSEFQYIRPGGS